MDGSEWTIVLTCMGAAPLMDPRFMGSNTVVYHHCPYWLMPFGGIPNFTYFQTKPFLGLTMINTTLGWFPHGLLDPHMGRCSGNIFAWRWSAVKEWRRYSNRFSLISNTNGTLFKPDLAIWDILVIFPFWLYPLFGGYFICWKGCTMRVTIWENDLTHSQLATLLLQSNVSNSKVVSSNSFSSFRCFAFRWRNVLDLFMYWSQL